MLGDFYVIGKLALIEPDKEALVEAYVHRKLAATLFRGSGASEDAERLRSPNARGLVTATRRRGLLGSIITPPSVADSHHVLAASLWAAIMNRFPASRVRLRERAEAA
jgi:hypothetical protein